MESSLTTTPRRAWRIRNPTTTTQSTTFQSFMFYLTNITDCRLGGVGRPKEALRKPENRSGESQKPPKRRTIKKGGRGPRTSVKRDLVLCRKWDLTLPEIIRSERFFPQQILWPFFVLSNFAREAHGGPRKIHVAILAQASTLPKGTSFCVALLRSRETDHGPQRVECRGRFVQGILETDFDGSSSAFLEMASCTACSSPERASTAEEGEAEYFSIRRRDPPQWRS